ncbi:MAG: M24 family metallopeptidase [Planctomycetaceae bacterium]
MSATPQLLLDLNFCRQRQRRLIDWMQCQNIDRALLVSHDNVQYFTGFRPHRLMSAAVLLKTDGSCTLIAPNEAPSHAAADEIISFAAQHYATLRQDQVSAIAPLLEKVAGPASNRARWGVEFACCPAALLNALGIEKNSVQLADVEPALWQIRRRKDPDELAMIGRAIACSEAMYAKARDIIEQGLTEIEVYNELQAAAVEVAGEPLTAFGNDFQCGTPGGPPRPRAIEAGELYILDLGPAYRGYYADSCRTFAVSPTLTDLQRRAWDKLVEVLQMVEETVKPGISCKQLFLRSKEMLDAYLPGAFFHHLGHGVGIFPHEAPHLNSAWDDHFEEGDVFTAEPGLYTVELRGGIRLEHMYRVTATGIERLIRTPLEMTK